MGWPSVGFLHTFEQGQNTTCQAGAWLGAPPGPPKKSLSLESIKKSGVFRLLKKMKFKSARLRLGWELRLAPPTNPPSQDR